MTRQQIIASLIAIATAEVGVRETREDGHATNHGRRVDEYQRADTLPGEGYSWCASFDSWNLKQLAAKLDESIHFCYSASCDTILEWGRELGVVHDRPEPGDIMLVMASHNDATHTGLVIAVNGASFTTVEGNTNDNGSREGDGVYQHTRTNSSRYLFVRWLDANRQLWDKVPKVAPHFALHVGARQLIAPLVGNTAIVAAREWGEALGLDVQWNAEHQTVLLQGREVPLQARMIAGRAYLPVRGLAQFCGLGLKVDGAHGVIEVQRAEAKKGGAP